MPLDNPFEPMIKNIGNYVSGTLYGPGVIPPIGITNYDGTALASPADTHLLAAKDPVIDEISVGISGNLIGENTVTGTPPLQLPNSAGYPLQWFEVALSPYQDLHGYDNPWPAGGGKNKLENRLTDGTSGGVLYQKQSDGGITAVGVVSSITATRDISRERLPNGTYILSGGNSSINLRVNRYDSDDNLIDRNTDSGSGVTIVIDDTVASLVWMVKAETIDEQVNTTVYPMVRLATESDATYAPYSNVCPILGTDKLNIFVEESYDPTATPKTVITLPNTLYGGTYDPVTGQGTITRVAMKVGNNFSLASGNVFAYSTSAPKKPVNNATAANIMSYEFKTTPQTTLTSGFNIAVPATADVIRINAPGYTSDEAFVAAFSESVICYELASPIPFSTDGHYITLPQGSATIWATAEDGSVDSMSASYIQNE